MRIWIYLLPYDTAERLAERHRLQFMTVRAGSVLPSIDPRTGKKVKLATPEEQEQDERWRSDSNSAVRFAFVQDEKQLAAPAEQNLFNASMHRCIMLFACLSSALCVRMHLSCTGACSMCA